MIKFKTGDYVRVLDGRFVPSYTGGWDERMQKYVGHIYKIKKCVTCCGDKVGYTLDMGKNSPVYEFDQRGLAPCKSDSGIIEDKIIITINKNDPATIIARIPNVAEAYAHCSPDDTFDFMTGAKLAFDRLMQKMKPETKEESKKFKFQAGDYVIGNDKATMYSITTKGVICVVDRVYDNDGYEDLYVHLPNHITKYLVSAECFDPVNVLTADIMCVMALDGSPLKAGHIYHVVNGKIQYGDGHDDGHVYLDLPGLCAKTFAFCVKVTDDKYDA